MGFQEYRGNYNLHSESDSGFGLASKFESGKSDKKGKILKFEFPIRSNRKVKKIHFSL
jgi:hypothetical protein